MTVTKYGYCWIIDKDRNEASQIQAMIEAGVDERRIFIDWPSGKDFSRPEYQNLKDALAEGDLLVVKSIDRLGRNYQEILGEWQEITQDIKADIRVWDLPLLDTTLHKNLLGTFTGDLILQLLANVAQREREYVKQRQAEGIAIAKARGKHIGRPKAEHPKEFKLVYQGWKEGHITAKKAMQLLNLKPTTFYKLVKEYEGRQ